MKNNTNSEVTEISENADFKNRSQEFLQHFDALSEEAETPGFVHFEKQIYFVEANSEAHKKIIESSQEGSGLTYPLGSEEIDGRTFHRYQINKSFFEQK